MGFRPGNEHGTSNGATDQTIVSAPPANITRIVKSMYIHNADTVAAVLNVFFDDGGTERKLYEVSLNADETWEWEGIIVLDETDQLLEINLDGAVTTNELDFLCSYGDYF